MRRQGIIVSDSFGQEEKERNEEDSEFKRRMGICFAERGEGTYLCTGQHSA